MIEQEIDGFLEHFGVRGMKWGIRNRRIPSIQNALKNRNRNLTPEQKRTRNKRMAIVGAGSVALIGATTVVGYKATQMILRRNRMTRAVDILNSNERNFDNQFIKDLKAQAIKELKNTASNVSKK